MEVKKSRSASHPSRTVFGTFQITHCAAQTLTFNNLSIVKCTANWRPPDPVSTAKGSGSLENKAEDLCNVDVRLADGLILNKLKDQIMQKLITQPFIKMHRLRNMGAM